MQIKVLGPGCTNCTTLEKRTLKALDQAGVDADLEKITDYAVIASYGMMSTPALVIDEQVVLSGRVPNVTELQTLLSENQSWPPDSFGARSQGREQRRSTRGRVRQVAGSDGEVLPDFSDDVLVELLAQRRLGCRVHAEVHNGERSQES